ELAAEHVREKTLNARARLDGVTGASHCDPAAPAGGGEEATPDHLLHMMASADQPLRLPADAVGLYGAIEVRHLAGPVFAEREYEVSGTILAVGQTPKTEYLWYETLMRDPSDKRDIASMLMMLRYMKASSPLWRTA